MSTEIRYPRPLRPGDTVAVTAPSAPVRPEHEARLTFVTDWLRGRGFEVVLGECLIGDGITSGSARARADEFNAFVRDQAVRAVVPAGSPVWLRVSATDWVEDGWSLDDFYFLARTTLVKDEKHFDKFDRAFWSGQPLDDLGVRSVHPSHSASPGGRRGIDVAIDHRGGIQRAVAAPD